MEQIPEEPDLDAQAEPAAEAESASWRRWMPALVSACVALAVSGAVMWVGMQRFAEQQRQTLAVTQYTQMRDEAHRQVGDSDWAPAVSANTTAIDMLTWPTAKSFLAGGTSNRPHARARVFVDEVRGKCAIYASGLAEMPPGHIYELWLTNADGKQVPAGTFEANRNGNGSYTTELPIAADHVTGVAVSLEPMQGSSHPTSDLLIRGRVN
jgi:anti-sigma-K factor RskA